TTQHVWGKPRGELRRMNPAQMGAEDAAVDKLSNEASRSPPRSVRTTVSKQRSMYGASRAVNCAA
ncbi:MAG: hypothetical protein ACI4P5_09695, partial [Candidatus Fimadaptatus sp.]